MHVYSSLADESSHHRRGVKSLDMDTVTFVLAALSLLRLNSPPPELDMASSL